MHGIGGKKISVKLQKEIDNIEPENYDAILLGHGLCNLGIKGLKLRILLVIPRAHDSITLLIGPKERYQKRNILIKILGFFTNQWDGQKEQKIPYSGTALIGMKTYQQYVKKYGQENKNYIMNTLEKGIEKL